MLLIVFFAWESQRDQTHLVLATTISTATLYVAIRLVKTRAPGWYCLLGVLAALGLLAKYNYAVMIVSLLLAALSLPSIRPAILDRKMLLTIACFLLIIAPHACWAGTNPELLLSQANKFNIPESGNFLLASLKGTGLLAKRILEFTIGPLFIFGLVCLRSRKMTEPSADRQSDMWIRRMVLIGLALCFITVFALHVTSIRARWLQPLLICLPMMLVVWTRSRLDSRRINLIFALTVFIMILVPTTMYGRIAGASWFGKPTNLNTPYRAFAEKIRSAGFTRGVIVTEGHPLAGNLRVQFPDSTIVAAWNLKVPLPATNQMPTLIAWRSTNHRIPEPLAKFVQQAFDIDLTRIRVQEISAPPRYMPNSTETLYFALVTARAKEAKTDAP